MNLLQKIANQSYKTVHSLRDKLPLNENITLLKQLVRKVTLSDLNLNPKLLENQPMYVRNDDCAPVTYVDVWKDDNFTMGVFVLKPGTRLPLHDHPHMYGFIKVVHGSCIIKPFSMKAQGPNGINSFVQPSPNLPIQVQRHAVVHATSSDVITLTPDITNIHEISALATPIAFFDVLLPPYDDDYDRPCNYYKVIEGDGENDVELMKINVPAEYWTDNEMYTGPNIEKEQVYDLS